MSTSTGTTTTPTTPPSHRTNHRPRAALMVAAGTLLGATLLLGAGPATASASGTANSTASRTRADADSAKMATIRVAHLSPDMPGVDIYLTSFSGRTTVVQRDATYGQLSAYEQIAPGSYTFAIRRHGAAAGSAPLQSWSVDTQAGDAYTAAVVGVGSSHRGVVFNDNLTPPTRGHANVRFIQASSAAKMADLDATDGPAIAQDAQFGSSTGYASIKAGAWPLQATGGGTTTDATISVRPGSVTSVILLDAPGHRTRLTSVIDAAGAATGGAPTGSVDAGGGGTAIHVVDRPAGHLSEVAGGAAATALLALGIGALAVRRRGHGQA